MLSFYYLLLNFLFAPYFASPMSFYPRYLVLTVTGTGIAVGCTHGNMNGVALALGQIGKVTIAPGIFRFAYPEVFGGTLSGPCFSGQTTFNAF